MTTRTAQPPTPALPAVALTELSDLTLVTCRPDGPVVHRNGHPFPGYSYGRLVRRNLPVAPAIIEAITAATPPPDPAAEAGGTASAGRVAILALVLEDARAVHARHPATPFPPPYRSALTSLFDTLGLNRFNDPRRNAGDGPLLEYLGDHLTAVEQRSQPDRPPVQYRTVPAAGNLPPPRRR